MHQIVATKFIKKIGYWFDIIQTADNLYQIYNTKRKKNQTDRDDIGYYISNTFDSLDKAKNFLNNMEIDE